ncbi:PucR family transcriptional regulator [Paenibacillus enshidis]|uniref:PucR family transcriptional regulator n=1 Tax=Paenibacillus enshidis TaxID=1458439 RepID=A0ABV5AXN6_9BACL
MNRSGLTVRELLKLPFFKDARLLSGDQGLDRVVRYIDILEVPDIKSWLREGEMIMTTGYSVRDDPSLLAGLVEELAHADGAALAFKPERFIGRVPQDMVDMSNLYHIPVIELPPGMPYIDITFTVMEQIVDKQAALLRRSEEVYTTLTHLVLNNRGIQAVADHVAKLIGSGICIVDKTGEMLVSSSYTASSERSGDRSHWEITVDNQLVGKLVVAKEELDELDLVCIEQARLVFALELMRSKIAKDTELRLQGSFFEELLMGVHPSRQEVEDKGRQLGLQPHWTWEVCLIEGGQQLYNEGSSFAMQLQELVHQEAAKRKVRGYVLPQGERLLLLLSTAAGDSTARKQPHKEWIQCLTPFLQRWSLIRVGFGSKRPLWELNAGYMEARKAVAIGTRLDREPHIYSFEQIEMLSLMLEAGSFVNFDTVIDRNLGRLVKYDKENDTDLVTTLYYYLTTGGSLMETATRMYIHRNSVKYRIDRIKELTDIDLDNSVNRLMYQLCSVFYLVKKTD